MKKNIGVLLSLFFIICIVGAVLFTMGVFDKKEEVTDKRISLDINELDLRLKDKYQFDVEYENSSTKQRILFVSDTPDVVSVNELTGYITAKKYGVAEITVMIESNPAINDVCYVYVSDQKQISSIKAKESAIKIGVGDSKKIEV